MSDKLTYFDTGEKIFKPGEAIYVNKVVEQVETHLHAHDFIEIAYVSSGSGIHCIGDSEYPVSKGNLFIINYNIPHEFRSLPDSTKSSLCVYNCIFKPEFLDYSLVNCKDFYNITHHFLFSSMFPGEGGNDADIKLLDSDIWGIQEIYDKMHREYQTKEQGYLEILRAYVIELLVTIFRLCSKNKSLNNKIEVRRRHIIEKVIQHMKNNYEKDLKLEDLSTIAFLSPNYFCKLFKDYTGVTLSEYTQKIRIEEACHLLKETDKKVIDISGEVGYKDIKFFNEIFKRHTNMTPGEYRKTQNITNI